MAFNMGAPRLNIAPVRPMAIAKQPMIKTAAPKLSLPKQGVIKTARPFMPRAKRFSPAPNPKQF